MARQRILGVVLAGGAGRRLGPLTADRAKSAVPFGGIYRVVDFALSNLVNGGMQRICVLTQYKSHSLNRHITTTWRLNSLLDDYVTPVPAQQRVGPRWKAGSADAIYQSLALIDASGPTSCPCPGPIRLPDGPEPADPGPPGLGCRRHRGRDPGASPRRHGLRRNPGRAPAATASRRSRKSPPTRPACTARRTRRSRPWAPTSSTPPCWSRR